MKSTRISCLFFLLLLGLVSLGRGADAVPTERLDWDRLFSDAGATGTMMVVDERNGASSAWVHDTARSRTRFSPASTFKVAHSLFALDAGVIKDEFQVIPWDGVKRGINTWNQDQTLRSAMRYSAYWVFQGVARQLGEARERAYLQSIDYGNSDPSGGVDSFWVDGRLATSAVEQIAFLQRLYRNQLPFRVEHQRLVKDVMIVEAGRDWILRAKSGWSGKVGWWVGWIEWPTGPVFFALNIDTPNRMADISKRDALMRSTLLAIKALPPQSTINAD
jgi:beta-lactamase class D